MINMIQGDCMDLMRSKPDNYYDLAIVDPPYRDRNQPTKEMRNKVKGKMKNFGLKPTELFFTELQRVSKNQIIWGANNFFEILQNTNCFLFWYKRNPMPNYSDGELAWTSFDSVAKCIPIDHFGAHTADKNKIHPTQKPVKLYEWILMNYATCKTCGNEGGYYEDVAGDGGSRMWQFCDDCTTHEKPVKILDTHGGSGSICLACHNLGFDLDWIELDQDYYEAAKKRYERHKRQLRMF